MHHTFFVHFFPVTARLRRETAQFHVLFEDMNTRRLSISVPELWCSLLEFNSRKNCQYLTKWMRWNKRDKVGSSAGKQRDFTFGGKLPSRCCFYVQASRARRKSRPRLHTDFPSPSSPPVLLLKVSPQPVEDSSGACRVNAATENKLKRLCFIP